MDEVDKMRESTVNALAVVLVVAALVIGVALFAFWMKNREKPYLYSIEILPGKSYEGVIEHDRTGRPEIEWRIDKGDVKIAILQGDKEIFMSKELQGSFSLEEMSEGTYRFVVTAERPVEIRYTISHRFVGGGAMPMVATRDIILGA